MPEICQEDPEWTILAPRRVTQPEQINEALGRERADLIARRLHMDKRMILTPEAYACIIAPGDPDRETIFRCIYNLTNSSRRASPIGTFKSVSLTIQRAWVVGGAARPTKITMPSPPGLPAKSISISGFQLLTDQMLPAWSMTTAV